MIVHDYEMGVWKKNKGNPVNWFEGIYTCRAICTFFLSIHFFTLSSLASPLIRVPQRSAILTNIGHLSNWQIQWELSGPEGTGLIGGIWFINQQHSFCDSALSITTTTDLLFLLLWLFLATLLPSHSLSLLQGLFPGPLPFSPFPFFPENVPPQIIASTLTTMYISNQKLLTF